MSSQPLADVLRCSRDVLLAVVVQCLMLAQVSFGYARLLWKWRGVLSPYDMSLRSPLTTDAMLSVVVPAYREVACIERTLRRLAAAAARPERLEILVVDAGAASPSFLLHGFVWTLLFFFFPGRRNLFIFGKKAETTAPWPWPRVSPPSSNRPSKDSACAATPRRAAGADRHAPPAPPPPTTGLD